MRHCAHVMVPFSPRARSKPGCACRFDGRLASIVDVLSDKSCGSKNFLTGDARPRFGEQVRRARSVDGRL